MGIRVVLRAVGLMVAIVGLAGCQSVQPALSTRLIAHVAMIDFSGLEPSVSIQDLKVRTALPQGWQPGPGQTTPLFVHHQWRSPSHMTGIGVAYIHLPLPMTPKTLLWFVRSQYSNKSADARSDGKLLGEWTDPVGREWFEGENAKYYVKGYAVTSGFDAWLVYSGYRLRGAPNPAEIGLAARSMDSIVPLSMMKQSSY